MKFEYGIEDNKVNITKIVLNKCIKNNIIFIPAGDIIRQNIFQIDPCKNVVKYIYINGVCFNDKEIIKINLNNKICICFYGLTRSLKYTINFIRNNILKILIKNNYYFDIYLHTYDLEYITNKRSNENTVKLDKNEYKLLNPDYFKITNQDLFDNTIDVNKYLLKGDPWPDNPKVSLMNLLRQLNSLKQVSLITNENNINYEYYLYLRPDLIYLDKFDCNIIRNCKDNEFYSPNWGKYGGLNDRMGFGKKDIMNKFAKRIDQALLYSQKYVLHSEKFLKYIMNNCIIKDINMKSNRVRANGIINRENNFKS